jgi:antitoxin MazE
MSILLSNQSEQQEGGKMAEGTISKWGNSLALRIPQTIAAELGIKENSSVYLTVKNDCLYIEKDYTLEELAAMITDENRQELEDFGPDVGKEVISS